MARADSVLRKLAIQLKPDSRASGSSNSGSFGSSTASETSLVLRSYRDQCQVLTVNGEMMRNVCNRPYRPGLCSELLMTLRMHVTVLGFAAGKTRPLVHSFPPVNSYAVEPNNKPSPLEVYDYYIHPIYYIPLGSLRSYR